ncbi:MAG: radical SAM protein [Firmicutes bacterium]|nr:radical SAM protein [Bacillota bacterium]
MAGRLGTRLVEPDRSEMIPLPEGASLVLLPGRQPVGINREGCFASLKHQPGLRSRRPVQAVAALLPQGYTRTLLPGYSRRDGVGTLPFFGYCAVGFKDGACWVAARQTDEDHRWNPRFYDREDLAGLIRERQAEFPGNRVLEQLGRCAREYSCFTAQNLFYRRWEAGIPVSPACNAGCVGCISLQESECCPSPQQRIGFAPTMEETAGPAAAHLAEAELGIVSFGQGCEGEPLLRGKDLVQAVRAIRERTDRGTININTNGSRPEVVRELARAGLDAMRVSLASANDALYEAYHRPQGYDLRPVKESIRAAVDAGVRVSLNLLHFPGVTDLPSETEALIELVRETGLSLIQVRNLNLDPEVFLGLAPNLDEEPLGVPAFLEVLGEELPGVEIGNYTRPKG